MALYRYQAVDAAGELVAGEIEAPARDAVVAHLHRLGHVPIRAEIQGPGWLSRHLALPSRRRRRSDPSRLAPLTRHLATLLGAGLALDRALEIAQRIVPADQRDIPAGLLAGVRGGSSLADALATLGEVFPPYYVGMVRAGEAGGSLDQNLRHLATFLERAGATREQVKSALIYPAIVAATGFGSLAVLFGFVIPTFRPLFDEAGAELPWSAQLILGLSEGFRDWWWALAGGGGLLALVLRRQWRRPEVRRWCDRRLLGLPVVGTLIAKVEMGRFCLTLGTLLHNGVAPLGALAIGETTVGNTALRAGIAEVAERVKEGKGLAEPLSRIELMPTLVADLTRVGEETARLDEMLCRIADIYDEETRRGVERLMAMLVPAITVALGAIVALVIGSILTAVLSVYDLAV